MLSPHRYWTATSGTIGSTTGCCSNGDGEEGTKWLLLPSPLWGLKTLLPLLLDETTGDEYVEDDGEDASELMGTVHKSV